MAGYSRYFIFRSHAEAHYAFAQIFAFAVYTILSFYRNLLVVLMTLTYSIPG